MPNLLLILKVACSACISNQITVPSVTLEVHITTTTTNYFFKATRKKKQCIQTSERSTIFGVAILKNIMSRGSVGWFNSPMYSFRNGKKIVSLF